jgi:hypothetical protein
MMHGQKNVKLDLGIRVLQNELFSNVNSCVLCFDKPGGKRGNTKVTLLSNGVTQELRICPAV